MRRTRKGEACRPPHSNLATQQRAFNAFRHLYNEERPHEALHDRPLATLLLVAAGAVVLFAALADRFHTIADHGVNRVAVDHAGDVRGDRLRTGRLRSGALRAA